jgi:branched-chain amino acid aminotransferase
LLEIDCGLSLDEMENLTLETLERNIATEGDDMDWQIMHDVSRGPMELYAAVFPEGVTPTVSINCWPLITHMGSFSPNYEAGVHLMIPAQQSLPAQLIDLKAKTRSRLHYRMAELQARRAGERRWPVMLDTDGFLAEGPGWNVFLISDNVLYTPEPRNVLLGVSRGMAIELAQKLGIEVRQTNLGRYEALMADEMFCTSTTYAMVHAATFEGQTVGDGTPGPVFRRLRRAWMDEVGVDFVAQAQSYARRLSEWSEKQVSRGVGA